MDIVSGIIAAVSSASLMVGLPVPTDPASPLSGSLAHITPGTPASKHPIGSHYTEGSHSGIVRAPFSIYSGNQGLTTIGQEPIIGPLWEGGNPQTFENYHIQSPTMIRPMFYGLVPACQHAQVKVIETEQAVFIGITTGQPASNPQQVCITLAVSYSAKVKLSKPLGGRVVVDMHAEKSQN